MTPKEEIVETLDEYILGWRIEWPEDIKDGGDLANLEYQISEALEHYDFSEYQMVSIVEYMYQNYKEKMERHTIRELINDIIKYDVPRMVAEHFAKLDYDYPKS